MLFFKIASRYRQKLFENVSLPMSKCYLLLYLELSIYLKTAYSAFMENWKCPKPHEFSSSHKIYSNLLSEQNFKLSSLICIVFRIIKRILIWQTAWKLSTEKTKLTFMFAHEFSLYLLLAHYFLRSTGRIPMSFIAIWWWKILTWSAVKFVWSSVTINGWTWRLSATFTATYDQTILTLCFHWTDCFEQSY